MAAGADEYGLAWARRNNIAVIEMPADWRTHGQRAGFIRNRAMAGRATHGLGFWHDESGGTANMATRLVVLGKPCRVLEWRPSKRGER